ncbi:MAG: TIGR00341 family protein [Planctomycetes bacterium]|nr:TIGR00341 family protein [Planctomycetota bacterium]
MSLRCLEIRLPPHGQAVLDEVLGERTPVWSWHDVPGGSSLHRIVIDADQVEGVLDGLQKRLSGEPTFFVVVLPVSAVIPAPKAEEKAEPSAEERAQQARRIAREELHTTLRASISGGPAFRAMVVLSAIVATVGLVQDSPAVVIGAMVIAPLLGPNMALALATALGDRSLLRAALRRNLEGVGLATLSALTLGLVYEADPSIGELAMRAKLTPSDLLLALASGAAGALAFTSGVSTTLVGVMVAVALLPPLATAALFVTAGDFDLAGRAAMLVWANVICINLSAVCVFLWRGVRPRTWWEQRASVRLAHASLVFWGLSLVGALVVAWLI